MRIVAILSLLIFLAGPFTFTACNSGSAAPFCDTTCNNDTLRFSIDHPDKPYVAIGMKDCRPDTVTWSHSKMGTKMKAIFATLTGKEVQINKSHFRYFFKDTSYVWLIFNECINGQGFAAKLHFNKSSTTLRKNGALNSFDPKFVIDQSLVAFTDKGNVFVEELATGKTATLTFGQKVDLDFTDIHDKIDSVVVTPTYMRARVKIDNEWKIFDKNITLQ